MDDGPEIARSGSLAGGESLQPDQSSLFQSKDQRISLDEPTPGTSGTDTGGAGGDFGGEGIFEGGLFDEPAAPVQDQSSVAPRPGTGGDDSDDDHHMDDFGGAPSPGGMSSGGGASPRSGSPSAMPQTRSRTSGGGDAGPALDQTPASAPGQDQTTLLQNENESFALAPVDASAVRGGFVRTKRKRKLIVDEIKAISGEEMKAQLSDTQDIVTTLDLAPPTKRLMHWKETGGVEKLFALPGRYRGKEEEKLK